MTWPITFVDIREKPLLLVLYIGIYYPHWDRKHISANMVNRRISSLPLAFSFLSLSLSLSLPICRSEEQRAVDQSFSLINPSNLHLILFMILLTDLHAIFRIKSWSERLKISTSGIRALLISDYGCDLCSCVRLGGWNIKCAHASWTLKGSIWDFDVNPLSQVLCDLILDWEGNWERNLRTLTLFIHDLNEFLAEYPSVFIGLL